LGAFKNPLRSREIILTSSRFETQL